MPTSSVYCIHCVCHTTSSVHTVYMPVYHTVILEALLYIFSTDKDFKSIRFVGMWAWHSQPIRIWSAKFQPFSITEIGFPAIFLIPATGTVYVPCFMTSPHPMTSHIFRKKAARWGSSCPSCSRTRTWGFSCWDLIQRARLQSSTNLN